MKIEMAVFDFTNWNRGFFKFGFKVFVTMDLILSFAVVILVVGLVGDAFEMRKIRLAIVKDEDMNSKNIFLNKRNWKGMP